MPLRFRPMIFTHGTVITMNPSREIIEDGAVVVSGSRIEAVGKTARLRSRFPEADEIDLTGHIVMPGLIDTHVHLAQTLLRGVSEGKRLPDFSSWLFGRIFPLQGSYTEDDARASAQRSAPRTATRRRHRRDRRGEYTNLIAVIEGLPLRHQVA